MVKLVEVAERSFARHETFHPRYSWFRKAYIHTVEDSTIFNSEDAPVRIGVGKNMVRAIRFWGTAAKLITAMPQDSVKHTTSRQASEYACTRKGWALFGVDGWDPYMEDPGTLWLLHWFMLSPQTKLPVWWLTFNEFEAVEFAETDLVSAVSTLLDTVSQWAKPHSNSIKKMLVSYCVLILKHTRQATPVLMIC